MDDLKNSVIRKCTSLYMRATHIISTKFKSLAKNLKLTFPETLLEKQNYAVEMHSLKRFLRQSVQQPSEKKGFTSRTTQALRWLRQSQSTAELMRKSTNWKGPS